MEVELEKLVLKIEGDAVDLAGSARISLDHIMASLVSKIPPKARQVSQYCARAELT